MTEAIPGERTVLAYTDRISYRQGETIELKAAGQGIVDIDMVRLHHPPDDPNWSTPCFSPVDAVVSQQVRLTPQKTCAGSYLMVSALPLAQGEPISASLYILPTLLDSANLQGIWSLNGIEGPAGVSVFLDASAVVLVWTNDAGHEDRLASPVSLIQDRWQILSFSIDPSTGKVSLAQRLAEPAPGSIGEWGGSIQIHGLRVPALTEVLIGATRTPLAPVATSLPGAPGRRTSFNGKIDSPVISSSALSSSALTSITPEDLRASRLLVAAWDFSQGQSTNRVVDVGDHHCHGIAVNGPARAMTGVNWQGDEQNWIHAPEQYGAIHFHDDDLDDSRWPVAASIIIPADLPTGIYGIRVGGADALEDEGAEMVTVIVTPVRRSLDVKTLVVLPTYTYIAYANLLGNGEQVDYVAAGLAEGDAPPHSGQNRLSMYPDIGGSLYDVHSDGSGRCYSTPRRPILNLRLDWKSSRRDAYRHMAADLYIMEWLGSLGVPYEVTTDHMLNASGRAAVEGYSTVLTGTHPEYISRQIIDTMHTFLDEGGSLLYLGGNGFYWVTTESAEIPELIEVRRGFSGTRTWTGKAGESHHSMTGELGALWRHRGLAPNKLLGVGFAAQGADGGAAGYERAPDALESDAAFLFDGVGEKIFGTTGYDMGGAAGDEVDRFSVAQGSAPWGTVVGSSLELSKFYKLAIEDIQMTRENTGGDHEKDVRADLTFTEHAGGGFVFSVGSISWVQSMAIGEFDNDVARITENALLAALARAGVEGASDANQE